MADTLTTQSTTLATVPSGSVIATDDAGAAGHVQIVKLAISTDGSATAIPATSADGITVNLGTNNDVTVSGTVPVTDNSGSLTVDAPVGTPVFVRLSDGSSAISTLPVSLVSVPSHAVTNAGTFAVQESGGALTALQIIDDWDEFDRAKVNPIVGQAGIAAGAGAAGATTQRVILATDGQPGAGTFSHNQVSVSSTATQVVASRSGRRTVTVVKHGSADVYLGSSSGVTTSNGVLFAGAAGSSASLDYSGDLYAILATGTQTVSYAEVY